MPGDIDDANGIPAAASISDHGLIGDMRTAALLDRWGRINWMCWPRFDSDPVFGSLIDTPMGGCWQLAPRVQCESRRRYLPDTNVLETTFTCAEGTVMATDFMAVSAEERQGSQLIRIIEGMSGTVPVRMRLRPGRGLNNGPPSLHSDPGVLTIGGNSCSMVVTASEHIEIQDQEATIDTVLRPGEHLVVIMSNRAVTADLADHAFTARGETASWWRDWTGRCRLPGTRREVAVRSALAIKLLQHQPTSTLVAAPTTSLPECIGGSRNWDYRYSWLRDSSMMVLALQRLGHHDEAMAFWDALARVAERHGDDLLVAYTVDGEPIPGEREIPDIPGYRGSRPVRIGNGATGQRQHDIYGHIMAAAAHCYHHMNMDAAAPQAVLGNIADLAARRWNRPDDSIWEVRNGRGHHTHSYLMSWLALDQAVNLAEHGALTGDTSTWATERDAARQEILDHAWNGEVGAFTSTIGGDKLDASVLVAPLIGFLPAGDPRVRQTRESISRHLGEAGLLYRYRQNDGIEGSEGAFLICTLWLADNYTLDNNPDRGEELLNRVLDTSNDLGLLAEEADPTTNEPLGNFPQGLTHLGVIQTLTRLDEAR
ncbi:glycoside hydrolase family 15 protein [Arthrobacter pigmenti]